MTNKPLIFYDFDRSKYVLYKDPRLPIYKAHFPTPISEKKLQIIVPRKPVDGVLVPLGFQEFQDIEKRKKESLKEFKAK